MDIEFLSWEIREPVKSRPLGGALVGGLTGLAFGLLADQGDFMAARSAILKGFGVGGFLSGLVIGACLPLFRSRVVAGIIVSVAVSIGFLVMHWAWADSLPPEASIFIGCATGFSYAVLFWKYRPHENHEAS